MIRTTLPTPAAQTPYGYKNLPGTLANWTAYKAPTTGDTVYFGQQASGQYAYVGPDNQPYVGSKSSFFFGPNGTVNPIIGSAQATSWASLGVSNADTNVYESAYTGPGANTQAQNDAFYSALTAQTPGETLVTNSTSLLGGAGGLSAGNTSTIPTPPPPATTPGSVLSASTPVTAASSNGTTSQSDPNNLSGTASIGSSDPYQSAFDSLIGQLTSGNAGASQGVPGSGSIAAGLPSVQQSPTTTTSTGSPILIVVLVVALIGVGIWWYVKHHKKAGTSEAGATQSEAA